MNYLCKMSIFILFSVSFCKLAPIQFLKVAKQNKSFYNQYFSPVLCWWTLVISLYQSHLIFLALIFQGLKLYSVNTSAMCVHNCDFGRSSTPHSWDLPFFPWRQHKLHLYLGRISLYFQIIPIITVILMLHK